MRTSRSIGLGVLLVGAGMLLAACGDDGDNSTSATAQAPIIFSAENNRLDAYQFTADGAVVKQIVDHNHAEDPSGRDINGQICFFPDGSHRFIAGEDTNQPSPPQGWGIFQLDGNAIGKFAVRQIGKLTPTYQSSPDNAENYGCGFLSAGRVVTTDVGDQADGPGNGQLIVWFPPFDTASPKYCKLDITIGTAGGIYIDSTDRIYVASARETPAVYRYTGPFPTSDTAAGGCASTDSTGAPMIAAAALHKEVFINTDTHVRTPNAVVASGHDTFYVSSVFNGVIAEYDASGTFVRRILTPVTGERLPYPSTGTPLGLGVDPAGDVYFADIAIAQTEGGIGPVDGLGRVRRIHFVNGAPQTPQVMDQGLDFPDGIGILR